LSFHTRIWHMAEDSESFRDAAQLEKLGAERNGNEWLAFDERTAPQRYLPLYEAKMIHQYDHRWATYDGEDCRDATIDEKRDPLFEPTPRYWVSERDVVARLAAKGWTRGWLLAWRDITSAHVLRSVIFSVLPAVAIGHTSPLMFVDAKASPWPALLANLNALTLDFVARQKIGGTHLTYGYLTQLPVLSPSEYTESDLAFIVARVLELAYTSHSMAPFARDLGYAGPPFVWDEDRRAQLRAELDAWYARAYELTRDELRYILDPADVKGPDYPSETFRVLKKNEIARWGEYRTARLVLAAWDAQEARPAAAQ
ncbi:MAG: restriction endonuclease, partial [Stellaceae bacterium]